MKLHHLHAAQTATRLEFDHPLNQTWRGEGSGRMKLKAEIARRLAVCWNVLEGIPTEALERGLLREVFEAIDVGDTDRARRAAEQLDAAIELTADGRLHACEACR